RAEQQRSGGSSQPCISADLTPPRTLFIVRWDSTRMMPGMRVVRPLVQNAREGSRHVQVGSEAVAVGGGG
ncbi:hypothetical protein ABVB25_42355, partial [Streptomyces anthocyanicus]|uniref:hypothetical protein n=1 Tax=Streptomyces anthocyanicus TaxID=68174 RepID=UPI00336AA6B3